MKTLADLFNRDPNVLDTDCDNLKEMFKDIKSYVKKTGDIVFNSDDPGYSHDPPREPRIGFVSEKGKHWTIKLSTVAKNRTADKTYLLKAADGRKELLDWLNGDNK